MPCSDTELNARQRALSLRDSGNDTHLCPTVNTPKEESKRKNKLNGWPNLKAMPGCDELQSLLRTSRRTLPK